MGKPDSYSEEDGEIVEKKRDKFTVGKYIVTVNPVDEEDFTYQENLIELYLVEEMLGFKEEEEETPRSTGVNQIHVHINHTQKTTKIRKKLLLVNHSYFLYKYLVNQIQVFVNPPPKKYRKIERYSSW